MALIPKSKLVLSALVVVLLSNKVTSCPYLRELRGGGGGGHRGSHGGGHGGGHGGDGGGGGGGGRDIIQLLLDSHDDMTRTVSHGSDGTITTQTTSDDADLVSLLQTHVQMMHDRVDDFSRVRPWDPFFVTMVDRQEEFQIDVTNITSGVKVLLNASTNCGQALIDGHTAVVTGFVETGREESSESHAVPDACLAQGLTTPDQSTTSPSEETGATMEYPVGGSSASPHSITVVLPRLIVALSVAIGIGSSSYP